MERVKKSRLALSDCGQRMGDSHPMAVLLNPRVEWIRDLHEEGFVGYKTLAVAFGVPKATIQSICNYSRRSATYARSVEGTPSKAPDGRKKCIFSRADLLLIADFCENGGSLQFLARSLGVKHNYLWQCVKGIKRPYDE